MTSLEVENNRKIYLLLYRKFIVHLKNKKQQSCSWRKKRLSKIIEFVSFITPWSKANITRFWYIFTKIIFNLKLTGVK